MKKRILSLVLALVMVVSLMSGLAITASAVEEVYYTLDGTVTGGSSGYADASSITQGSMDWSVVGNTTMNPWRLGGKSLTAVDRTVASATAMGDAITKVELQTGTVSGTTVNSLQLIVASDSDFTTVLDTVTGTFAASSTITFTPTSGTSWASGSYYKFVFNLTITSTSNKYIQFTGATFYHEVSTPSCTHDNATSVTTTAATCTEAGVLTWTCPDCNETWTEAIPATGHTWGSWTTVTAAACTTDGSQSHTCSVCNTTETEAIPATGHTFVNGVCSVCGATAEIYEPVTAEPVSWAGEYLIGHIDSTSGNVWVFNGTDATDDYVAATPDQDGKITYASGMAKVTIAAGTNDYTLAVGENQYMYSSGSSNGLTIGSTANENTIAYSQDGVIITYGSTTFRFNASSGQNRFRYFKTSTTGAAYTYPTLYKLVDNTPACEHNWVAGTAVPATCTTDGYTPYTCSLCGATKQDDVVPALGHSFGAATDNNNGTHTQTCSRCNETITADCTFEVTEAGGNEFECTVCGYTKEVTQYYKNSTVANGDQVVIYNPSNAKALSATASGSKLAGVDVPSDYYSTTKLCIPEGAAVMTVADYNNGQFHLTIDDNGTTLYLTSGATGNSLSFAALADPDYALWEIDTTSGLVLKNVNAAYNGNAQALEYYNNFTTYGANTTAAYQMELFTDATPTCLHESTTLTGVVAATCLLPGYSGDQICDNCGETIVVGSVVPATGHNFVDGTCANCGATQLTAVNVTSLTDGETVYIYSPAHEITMTAASATTGRLVGVASSVSGNVLTTSSDAIAFTVHVVTGGYKFEASSGLFLTYGDDRNTLSLAAAGSPDKGVWSLDASYHLIDVNSGYQYNGADADLYLEAYGSDFTTYATNNIGSDFVLAFYDPNATDCEHVWDAGVANPAATCVDSGIMTYTCTLCGQTRTEVIPATGVHTYVNGVCSVCGAVDPSSIDYSGNYYIATIRTSGNYFWATNTVANSRYTAEDSGLTTLPAEIDSNVDAGKVWTLTKQQDGTYILSSGGSYSAYTSGNTALLDADAANAKALTVTEPSSGIFHITFENEESGSTVTRYLSLNGTSGNNYFAYYKNTQKYDLSLVPVTGTIPTPATHTAESHAAVAATCTTAGNVAYYTCAECELAGEGDHYGKFYSDDALTTEIADTVIAALGHNWVAGETVLPSCTTDGYTAYTCSRCNETKQDDIVAATGHTLVYTDNGDGTHDATCSVCSTLVVDDEACTYASGVCTLCGATEPVADPNLVPELQFSSITLNIQSYIGVDFGVRSGGNSSVVKDYDSFYAVIAVGSNDPVTFTSSDFIAYSARLGYFEVKSDGTQMTETITATLYAVKNGVTYHGNPVTYSVRSGMMENIAAAKAADLTVEENRMYYTMLVDMLNYGAQAQLYFNNRTDDLANSELTSADQAYATSANPTFTETASTSGSGAVSFKNFNLAVGSTIELNASITITGSGYAPTDLEAHITYGDTTEVVDCFGTGSKTAYMIYNTLPVTETRTPLTITIHAKDGGACVSNTWTGSLAALVPSIMSSTPEAVNLLNAMMKYADSCATYFTAVDG